MLLLSLLPACGPDDAAPCGGCNAAGSGGAGGSAGGGAGTATECTELVLSPSVLGSAGEWFSEPQAFRGALARGGDELFALWGAYRFLPEAETALLDDARPVLVATTVTLGSGAVRHEPLELFPPDVSAFFGAVTAATVRPTGAFAAGYDWVDGDVDSAELVALGNAMDTSTLTSVEAAPSSERDAQVQTALGFDGEAFVVHATSGSTLLLARVSPTASVVLPFTPYGRTPSSAANEAGHRTVTVSGSGRTYVFDAAGGNALSGHLREGEPLPGTESAPKTISAVGLATRSSASLPVLGANADGVWVAWQQHSLVATVPFENVVQRLDEDGNPMKGAFLVPFFPDPDVEDGVTVGALLPLPDGHVSIVAWSPTRIYELEYDGATLGPPRVIVEDTAGSMRDLREMALLSYQGERWLSYEQQGASAVRLLELSNDCTYPPLADGPGGTP